MPEESGVEILPLNPSRVASNDLELIGDGLT